MHKWVQKQIATIRTELGIDAIFGRLDVQSKQIQKLRDDVDVLQVHYKARHCDQKAHSRSIFSLEGNMEGITKDFKRMWETYQQLKRGLPKEVIAGDYVSRGRHSSPEGWVVLIGIEDGEARVLTLRETKGQPMQTFVNMINNMTCTESIRHDALIDCGPAERQVLRNMGIATQTLRPGPRRGF